MKPRISILSRAFAYRPSYATAIAETWRRFGWRPAQRDAQQAQAQPQPQPQPQPRKVKALPRTWHSEHANNRGGTV